MSLLREAVWGAADRVPHRCRFKSVSITTRPQPSGSKPEGAFVSGRRPEDGSDEHTASVGPPQELSEGPPENLISLCNS